MKNIRQCIITTLKKQSVQIGILGILIIALAIVIATRISSDTPRVKRHADTGRVASMQEQIDGDYTYRFDAINWVFDNDQSFAVNPETKVGFQFENFSRRETMTPAVFSKPFLVGVYQGACTSAEELPGGVTEPFSGSEDCSTGPLVAVALCGAEGSETPIAIHQCGLNLVVSEYDDTAWKEIRTLNMAELIK